MKKIFTIAAVAVATLFGTVNANAEGLYVGGAIGYWHDSKDASVSDMPTNAFTIMPEVGYNINSKWAIGTQIGYDFKHICNTDADSNIFRFNPYARYTFFRTNNNLVQLFLDGTAGIGLGWGDDWYGDHTLVTWQVGVKPGIAVNLTKKFSVVAHVGMLGYEGANNAAKRFGYKDQGGLLIDNTKLDFGFYFNF